jgi:hypothetical protein
MKTVYYAPKIDDYNMPYDHPILDPAAFIEPVPFLQYYKDCHENHSYWKCPAWKKYYKNSYVFFSQFDIEVRYNKESGIVEPDAHKYFSFDEVVENTDNFFQFNRPNEEPPKKPYHGVLVGQTHQHFVFWPRKEKQNNLWLEILPIPDMIKTHNLELIGGEFPFSRWFRPCLFAFKFNSEVTKINRGDPIGIIKFKNLDDYMEDIILERKEIPESIVKRSHSHSFLKIFLPNRSWNLIKDKPKRKCPVSWWRRLL